MATLKNQLTWSQESDGITSDFLDINIVLIEFGEAKNTFILFEKFSGYMDSIPQWTTRWPLKRNVLGSSLCGRQHWNLVTSS